MDKLVAYNAEGVDVSGAPKEIKLLPLGHVRSEKGDFLVDDQSVDMICKHFTSRRLDLVIDYEHQTLEGTQAPAAGWIKRLYKGSDALMGEVEWTAAAEQYLANKEYRYLSPVVVVRDRDKRACRLHSSGLTNTPAIDGMFAIVNTLTLKDITNQTEGGSTMDMKELAKLLGLEDGASEEEIKKALETVIQAAPKENTKPEETQKETEQKLEEEETELVANSTILSLLGLGESARTEDVTATIMALKGKGMNVEAEVLALKQKLAKKDADSLVESALAAGKITPAQKDWAMAYALKDTEGFNKFVSKAPVVVPMGRMDLTDAPRTGNAQQCNALILKACGLTQEDFQQYACKEDME